MKMTEERAQLAAIVVNWNRRDLTFDAVDSLLTQMASGDVVVVVDNGSSGDESARLTQRYRLDERVNVLSLVENTGFTGGVNAGYAMAREAKPDYILLLNNDATLEPGCIGRLIRAAQASHAGVVGALVQNLEGEVVFSGRAFPGELFGRPHITPVEQTGWAQIGRADGCAMLIAGDVADRRFLASGWLLDPRFFLYWEDVDLCIYARSIGRPTIISFDSVVKHKVAASSGGPFNPRGTYYQTRNRVLIARKWLPVPELLLFHVYFLLSRIAVQILRLPRGNARVRVSALALIDAYRGRYGRQDDIV